MLPNFLRDDYSRAFFFFPLQVMMEENENQMYDFMECNGERLNCKALYEEETSKTCYL